MIARCTSCGSRFTESKPGDDVCPTCRDRWEQEEQLREEEEKDGK